MKRKYGFVAVMLSAILVVGLGLTALYTKKEKAGEERGLKVVTSFFPMYIIAENIIGDSSQVSLENLSEPQTGCLHDFQLTPADMKLLSEADVFVVNGGGIESFLADVAASYPGLQIVNACEGMELLCEEEEDDHGHAHGDEGNAHAWMSVSRYMQLVDTVAGGLASADEANAKLYLENAASYRQRLLPLEEELKELKESVEGKTVVSFHEAYAYVAEDLGLEVAYTLDLDEERQISAGEVADVLGVIEEGARVVLAEELYGKEMGDTILGETDAQVIYLDTLVRGSYEKDSYLNGMEKNIRLLREAFTQ